MALAEEIVFRGMPAVRWTSADGASAMATLQGAHVVSWTPAGGEEVLFVSERSAFEPGRAIRGGIPVCFPQFAERGPLVKHGFARTLPWLFQGAENTARGARATFALESTPATLALWPHAFGLELAATVGQERLEVALQVTNRGPEALSFAGALHTYLRTADATLARLLGLRGVRYADREPAATGVEPRDAVDFVAPIDRVYFSAPPSTRLEGGGRLIGIDQHGFADTVVWNPGAALAQTMADMPSGGWRHMVCVEAATVEPALILQPGARWRGAQTLRCS